jgi:hypothetical protein
MLFRRNLGLRVMRGQSRAKGGGKGVRSSEKGAHREKAMQKRKGDAKSDLAGVALKRAEGTTGLKFKDQ